MTFSSTFNRSAVTKAATLKGWLIYYFSLYLVPISILLGSSLALLALNNLYPITQGKTLGMRLLPDPGAEHRPDTALTLLQTQTPVQRSQEQNPTWLLVDVPSLPDLGEHAIDLPSQHTQSLACWDADTMQSMGTADRSHTTGSLRASKQGFAVMLGG